MQPGPCIAFVGESKVGKTALICRVYGDFFPSVHHPTTEDIYNLNLFLSEKAETVQLIDTSGQRCPDDEELHRLAQAFVVVFSVKNRQSFETATRLVQSLTAVHCGPVLLIGNQAEEYDTSSRSQVGAAEANSLASSEGVVEYVEMSALDEVNTDGLRQRLACLLACIGDRQDVNLNQSSHSKPTEIAANQARARKSSSQRSSLSRKSSWRLGARAKKQTSDPLCSTPTETPGCKTPGAAYNLQAERPSASHSASTDSLTTDLPSSRRAEPEGQSLNGRLIEDYVSKKHRQTDVEAEFAKAHELRQQDRALTPLLRHFANRLMKASQGFQVSAALLPKFKRSRAVARDDSSVGEKQGNNEHSGNPQFESIAERVSRKRSFRVQRRPREVHMFEPTADHVFTLSDGEIH